MGDKLKSREQIQAETRAWERAAKLVEVNNNLAAAARELELLGYGETAAAVRAVRAQYVAARSARAEGATPMWRRSTV